MFIAATIVGLLCREITVVLDEWTWGWDGVGCMSQHGDATGFGIMIVGTEWGWKNRFCFLYVDCQPSTLICGSN